MKYRTCDLKDGLLTAAVAKAYGVHFDVVKQDNAGQFVMVERVNDEGGERCVYFDEDDTEQLLAQILEQGRISVVYQPAAGASRWLAASGDAGAHEAFYGYGAECGQYEGETALVAILRAYAGSKFGEEVDL